MRTIWSITPVYNDNICRNLCQVFATSLSHPTSLTAGQRLLPLSPLSPSPSFLFASSSSIIIVILIFITTIIIIIEIRWAVVPPQFYSHGHNQVCTSTMFSNDKWAKRCDDGKLVLMKCDGDEVVKWASEGFSSEPFHSWWCAELILRYKSSTPTSKELSSSIFQSRSVSEVSVSPDQIATIFNI